ncbi:MAG TPA: VOC family protein [Ktedonobacteraceae bacterium]|nr:VOC family protein [Ktedonobacteraceae bacterium]
MMALQLSMVGLTVQDMEKSKEFYRRLGLAVPEENPKQPPLMINMEGEFTLFLAPGSIQSERTASGEHIENYRVLFEYYVKSQAAVEAKYAELIGYGYQSYRAPFLYANGMYYALINDPDGNTILLAGDAEKTA